MVELPKIDEPVAIQVDHLDHLVDFLSRDFLVHALEDELDLIEAELALAFLIKLIESDLNLFVREGRLEQAIVVACWGLDDTAYQSLSRLWSRQPLLRQGLLQLQVGVHATAHALPLVQRLLVEVKGAGDL